MTIDTWLLLVADILLALILIVLVAFPGRRVV